MHRPSTNSKNHLRLKFTDCHATEITSHAELLSDHSCCWFRVQSCIHHTEFLMRFEGIMTQDIVGGAVK